MRVSLKWSLVFFCLILLPVAALTYRSVQSLKDERQSVIEEQQLLAPLLQDTLEQLVGRITAEIAYTELQALNPLAYTSFAEVEAVFVVNAAGNFIYPPQLPLRLAARRPLFAEAMRRGGLLEFEQQDSKAAAVFYEQLLQKAKSEAESAEILNALGRCALKAENSKLAIEIQTKLRRHLFTLDADGTHPATLHLLRLAQHWGYGRGSALL